MFKRSQNYNETDDGVSFIQICFQACTIRCQLCFIYQLIADVAFLSLLPSSKECNISNKLINKAQLRCVQAWKQIWMKGIVSSISLQFRLLLMQCSQKLTSLVVKLYLNLAAMRKLILCCLIAVSLSAELREQPDKKEIPPQVQDQKNEIPARK